MPDHPQSTSTARCRQLRHTSSLHSNRPYLPLCETCPTSPQLAVLTVMPDHPHSTPTGVLIVIPDPPHSLSTFRAVYYAGPSSLHSNRRADRYASPSSLSSNRRADRYTKHFPPAGRADRYAGPSSLISNRPCSLLCRILSSDQPAVLTVTSFQPAVPDVMPHHSHSTPKGRADSYAGPSSLPSNRSC